MDVADFAKSYETRTNEELLRLALHSEELVPEAAAALASELAKRKLDGATRLAAFRDEEKHREVELAKNPGSLFLLHPYGIGRKRFGKASYEYVAETRLERFRTTVFIVFFGLPLIPTGSYLVERRRGFLSGQMIFLEKLSLDWEQVLKVWIAIAGILLALRLAFKFLLRF